MNLKQNCTLSLVTFIPAVHCRSTLAHAAPLLTPNKTAQLFAICLSEKIKNVPV